MTKVCKACGVAPAQPEPPVPPKHGGIAKPVEEPEKCPNCGKEGTMEEVPEMPTGEEEEE